jgi:hypothetical protein
VWLLTVALAAALLGFLGLSLWRGREALLDTVPSRCPACSDPLVQLTDGPSTVPPRSYDVLACRSCGQGVTMVHGTRSLFAYCPACQQLSMRTDPHPAGRSGDGPRIVIEEECHLCGHEASRVVPDDDERPAEREGKVLPFRR